MPRAGDTHARQAGASSEQNVHIQARLAVRPYLPADLDPKEFENAITEV